MWYGVVRYVLCSSLYAMYKILYGSGLGSVVGRGRETQPVSEPYDSTLYSGVYLNCDL